MISVEAGPYELTKKERDFFDKVTFCLMSDNSISQRNYNKYGSVMSQKQIATPDLETAVSKLDAMMSQLKSNNYKMEDNIPVSTVPKVLGKRPAAQPKAKNADPAVKKRDVKEESKDEPIRRSNRKINYTPIYDEKEIAKLIAGTDDNNKGKDDGAINVMLAQTYNPDTHDPKGWLMSEKLDGVRCYWDGANMFTRNGNRIFAPKEWIAKLPTVPIDGELWSGRDSFQ